MGMHGNLVIVLDGVPLASEPLITGLVKKELVPAPKSKQKKVAGRGASQVGKRSNTRYGLKAITLVEERYRAVLAPAHPTATDPIMAELKRALEKTQENVSQPGPLAILRMVEPKVAELEESRLQQGQTALQTKAVASALVEQAPEKDALIASLRAQLAHAQKHADNAETEAHHKEQIVEELRGQVRMHTESQAAATAEKAASQTAQDKIKTEASYRMGMGAGEIKLLHRQVSELTKANAELQLAVATLKAASGV